MSNERQQHSDLTRRNILKALGFTTGALALGVPVFSTSVAALSVSLTVNPEQILPGESTTATVTAVPSENQTIRQYYYFWGDDSPVEVYDTSATRHSATHTYNLVGSYTIEVAVLETGTTQRQGATGTVTVAEPVPGEEGLGKADEKAKGGEEGRTKARERSGQ